MKTQVSKTNRSIRTKMRAILLVMVFALTSITGFAHCDSYDGPVIKDALTALENNNVELVLKWIDSHQEQEVIALFKKTYDLRDGDNEVYTIVEKHFLETLVRLHRETEGAPFTGLKPAGSMTPMVEMADRSIEINSMDEVSKTVTTHLARNIHLSLLKMGVKSYI